jgi:hypothetical protein
MKEDSDQKNSRYRKKQHNFSSKDFDSVMTRQKNTLVNFLLSVSCHYANFSRPHLAVCNQFPPLGLLSPLPLFACNLQNSKNQKSEKENKTKKSTAFCSHLASRSHLSRSQFDFSSGSFVMSISITIIPGLYRLLTALLLA